MNGAREYAELFATGQYGKLYLTSGHHARGKTFRIQVLPDDEKAVGNGENNQCLNEDAVEVYGITGGNPGWTETYGWLRTGKWVDDFNKMVAAQKEAMASIRLKETTKRAVRESNEEAHIQTLLAQY